MRSLPPALLVALLAALAGCAGPGPTTTGPAGPAPEPTAMSGSGIEGDWKMQTEFDGQMIDAVMSIAREDGALTGVWTSMGIDMDLIDLAVDGDTITFKRDVQGTVITFEGTLDGDTIDGRYTGGMGDLPCRGARMPPAS